MGTGINIGSGIEFKLGKDTEVNIDQSLKLNQKSWRSGSQSQSSSISLKLKLANWSKGCDWSSSN